MAALRKGTVRGRFVDYDRTLKEVEKVSHLEEEILKLSPKTSVDFRK